MLNRFRTFIEMLVIAQILLTGSPTTLEVEWDGYDPLAHQIQFQKTVYEPITVEQAKVGTMEILSSKNKSFANILDTYYISETVWYYNNAKKLHLGNDYESIANANIYAPISAYVIMKDDSVKKSGYLGCTDGKLLSGSGNSVYLIGEMNHQVYGFIIMHCKSILVDVGDLVLQNEVIATVGDTGNADSPHVHLEMYYLGKGSIIDYMNKEYEVDFGIGRDVLAYRHRCEVSDTTPCILDSREYIGAYKKGN